MKPAHMWKDMKPCKSCGKLVPKTKIGYCKDFCGDNCYRDYNARSNQQISDFVK